MNLSETSVEDDEPTIAFPSRPPGIHQAPLDEDEWEEPEPEPEPGPSLTDLHEELVATTAETRRGNRRVLDVLKNFGSVLDALSTTVNDTHRTLRSAPAPSESALPTVREQVLPLLELADRIARVGEGFSRPPAVSAPWWSFARKPLQAWNDAWSMQANAFHILQSHTLTLLKQASLSRLDVIGKPFDPNAMVAVESTVDSTKPDHTVLAELLPGWIHTPTNQLIRPAQVRVSRTAAH